LWSAPNCRTLRPVVSFLLPHALIDFLVLGRPF
jgi:hypothetical protein